MVKTTVKLGTCPKQVRPHPTIIAKRGRNDVTWYQWEHTSDVHEGIQGPSNGENDYKPVVYKSFRDPLTRIQDEGTRIKLVYDDDEMRCLNSMVTYYRAEYVRLRAEKEIWSSLGLRPRIWGYGDGVWRVEHWMWVVPMIIIVVIE